MAALPVAHAFLDRAECDPRSLWGGIGNRAEAVADILIIARSREFQRCCKELDLGSKAHDVAVQPAAFRLAITRARALRNRSRRK